MFATHTVTDPSGTGKYFQHCKFVSSNSDATDQIYD